MLGKVIGGRYRIIRHLGGGGFGQTYLAEDGHLPGKPACVVKQLKPKVTDPEALQAAQRLFDTEAEVLYALGSHEQIPRLFAHFAENQDFYLAQELIEGETLSQELKTHGRFSEAEIVALLQDLLSVLTFVHQQQVIHRDIKPSNLMRRQSDRRIVLIDFGAVKQIGMQSEDGTLQATVTIAVGSSGYMPNEQLAGKPRFSSDIYAVGMLAIQCLTGIYPKRLEEDPTTSEILWQDHAQVSPKVAEILNTMVRYDYRQRYASAKEAADALTEITKVASVVSLLTEPQPISADGHLVWLERGDELFQQQRYRDAVSAYDHLIQAKPTDYLAWFKRAIALEHLNCHADATASYDRVVQLHPEDYLAWHKRGAAFEHLQRYSEALESFQQVVELQPDNYWAWQDQGRILEQLQRMEEALAAYDRAVQLKPDFELAVASRKRLLSQLKRVDTLYHLQHYDEAVASCDRAIEQNPRDSLAWLMRGMALENLQRLEAAIAAYDRVVDIQPDDHVAWFKRGNTLEKLQDYEEAIASYTRVVRLQPDNYWAWQDLGRLLEQSGQTESAIAAYDRVVQIKPGFEAAITGRMRVLQQLQHPSFAPSEEDETVASAATSLVATEPMELPNAVSSNPPVAPLPATPGNRIETMISHPSRRSAAIAAPATVEKTQITVPKPEQMARLDQTHQLDPNEPEDETVFGAIAAKALEPSSPVEPLALDLVEEPEDETVFGAIAAKPTNEAKSAADWFRQAQGLLEVQNYAEALIACDRACQLCPTDADFWHWQGNLLVTMERYAEAIAAYSKAVQLAPENIDLWHRMGTVLTRLQRYQEAVACFNRAIKLKPDSASFWYCRGRVLSQLKEYPKAIQSFDRALQLKPGFQQALRDRQQVLSQLQPPTLKTAPLKLKS
jgi:tetratricopeptide (TPR) repeat protein/tRNA A-37 threonylcarbamoyl transferase component Bud32